MAKRELGGKEKGIQALFKRNGEGSTKGKNRFPVLEGNITLWPRGGILTLKCRSENQKEKKTGGSLT